MSYSVKVCVLGDFSVGKTSLVRKFAESRFDDRYLSTIGVRVSRKVIQLPEEIVTMLVWDTAGSEPFNDVVRAYYRGASGALLVCDLTRPNTVQSLSSYAQQFHSVNPGVPLIILGNKVDLVGTRVVSDDQIARAADQLNAPWYLTSAKTGEAVEESFQALGRFIHLERNRA